MKLAKKLTDLILLGMMLVLAVALITSVRRELRLFDTDMKRDHQVLGRALAAALSRPGTVGRDGVGEELLDRVNAEEGTLRATLRHLRRTDQNQGPLLRDGIVQFESADAGLGARLVTRVHVAHDEASITVVELTESTDIRQTYVRATVVRTLVTALGIGLVTAIAAIVVGVYVVGRRVNELVRFTRTFGAGDINARVTARGNDELSEIGEALNSMAEKLQIAQMSLRQASEAKIHALEQLRHADRLATVGKLASGIAHELGTPLNVVGGRAKMLQRAPGIDEASAKNAKIIVEQSARMAQIIRQLLDFARVGASHKQFADLRHLIEQSAHLLEPLARKMSAQIRIETPERPVVLEVDPEQIHQVLTNLIVNGIQATCQSGTVSVVLAVIESTRTAADSAPDLRAQITISDQGSGIAEDVLPRIFEPFFTTKGIGEGTGLGLSVAWGIVEEHGGTIGASNRVDERGAQFVVELPLPPPAADPAS